MNDSVCWSFCPAMAGVLLTLSLTDLQHHLFLRTFSGVLGLAPPAQRDAAAYRVLDLGTGTGIWAMDYGDEHPGAEVRQH